MYCGVFCSELAVPICLFILFRRHYDNGDDGTTAMVVAGVRETEELQVRNGVRHGCVLTPMRSLVFLSSTLYISRIEDIEGVNLEMWADGRLFNWARQKARLKVRQLCVKKLLYAYDIALVSRRVENQQMMLLPFSGTASLFGLQVSTDSTKIMH